MITSVQLKGNAYQCWVCTYVRTHVSTGVLKSLTSSDSESSIYRSTVLPFLSVPVHPGFLFTLLTLCSLPSPQHPKAQCHCLDVSVPYCFLFYKSKTEFSTPVLSLITWFVILFLYILEDRLPETISTGKNIMLSF
jgi:hypothetical protein